MPLAQQSQRKEQADSPHSSQAAVQGCGIQLLTASQVCGMLSTVGRALQTTVSRKYAVSSEGDS